MIQLSEKDAGCTETPRRHSEGFAAPRSGAGKLAGGKSRNTAYSRKSVNVIPAPRLGCRDTLGYVPVVTLASLANHRLSS
jgi:hypothetical protein